MLPDLSAEFSSGLIDVAPSLTNFGLWPDLGKCGSSWPKLDLDLPNASEIGQVRPKVGQLRPSGPNLVRI